MSMRRLVVPAVLGVAHGVADGAAGLLLGGFLHSLTLAQAGALVLLYNALAFGGQPFAGILVDRSRQPRNAAVAGLLLLAVALIALSWHPATAAGLAGLGSAFFHAGGGALAIGATRDRAAGPGFFAAPGVAGLAIGGALALTNHIALWPFVLMLLASGAAIITLRTSPASDIESRREPLFDDVSGIVLLLLAAIALRSAVWSSLQFVFQGQVRVILLLGLAAFSGKLAGGILADRIGWRRWTVCALAGAAVLLALGEQHFLALLVGVALLQSATPVALAAMARLLPGHPATAAGLALGLGIAAGGVPAYGGLTSSMIAPPVVALLMSAAAAALWRVLRSERNPGSLCSSRGLA